MQNHTKIIDDVLRNNFIPAIINESSISEHFQELTALPKRLRGMAVTTSHDDDDELFLWYG